MLHGLRVVVGPSYSTGGNAAMPVGGLVFQLKLEPAPPTQLTATNLLTAPICTLVIGDPPVPAIPCVQWTHCAGTGETALHARTTCSSLLKSWVKSPLSPDQPQIASVQLLRK